MTAGGSICIEALTLSGTAGSWTSQYNVEAILNIVILNMIGKCPCRDMAVFCPVCNYMHMLIQMSCPVVDTAAI